MILEYLQNILEYLQNNWLEVTGAILSLVYLFFSIRANSILWIFGFISSALYVAVFFNAKFYAEMSLYSYYLFVSVYGWINWHKKSEESNHELPITRIVGAKQIFQYISATIAIYITYYLVLEYLTDSPIALADSVVGALSIIATWMLAKKKIENWLVWIVVDAFAAGFYFSKELYPTAILFVIYTIMAVVGYRQWKRSESPLNPPQGDF